MIERKGFQMNQPIEPLDQTPSVPDASPQPIPVEPAPAEVQLSEKPKRNWVITLIIILFAAGAGFYFVNQFFLQKDNVDLGGDIPLAKETNSNLPVYSFSPNPIITSSNPIAPSSPTPTFKITGHPLALNNLKNLTYSVDGQIFALNNGFYSNQDPKKPITAKLNETFIAYNNPDPTKATQAAAVISTRYGGLETYYFVTVIGIENGYPTQIDAQLIDDRPILHGISFNGANIHVVATIHNDNDQPGSPTLKATMVYALSDGLLIQDSQF